MMITYAQAVREAMAEEMRRDRDVVLIGEDIGVYGGAFGVTRGMWEEFGPERMLETPISETAFTGAGVGMALMGLRPVVEIMFGDFTSLVIDPIVNHAAKYRFMSGGRVSVPIVVRTPFGAGTGAAAQHSQSLESMFLNSPGLTVIAPSNPADAKGLLKSAIRSPGPVLFCENKLLYREEGEVPEGEDVTEPIGVARVCREGEDITLISWSRMAGVCLEAAAMLEKEGISCEVIDLRTLRPLDTPALTRSVKKTSRALIVHEAPAFGGFGGEVAASLVSGEAFYHLDAPVERLGGAEMPVAYNPVLEREQFPSPETVALKARAMVNGNAS